MPANKYPRAADPKQGTGSSKLQMKALEIQKGGRALFCTTACTGGVGYGANLFCEYSDAEIHIWGN
jgi:hypothetical protein